MPPPLLGRGAEARARNGASGWVPNLLDERVHSIRLLSYRPTEKTQTDLHGRHENAKSTRPGPDKPKNKNKKEVKISLRGDAPLPEREKGNIAVEPSRARAWVLVEVCRDLAREGDISADR